MRLEKVRREQRGSELGSRREMAQEGKASNKFRKGWARERLEYTLYLGLNIVL